ncbi:cilia- and flagella-associated protein 47-like [Tupaia chinensis]|uniref:cilia- and flagella-associated protein 47-like n=1 Tax=Tupaia chinensis TaxID=246437 RepID=UPI000FFC931A|nr:cilia- and flagella-associated protein 47-like [Tupaia chinensis]
MTLYKTMVIVQMTKANKRNWRIDNFDELNPEILRPLGIDNDEIQAIYWLYPIIGLPQAPPPKCPQVVITCQARKRVEEKVEVKLNGNFFGDRPSPAMKDFSVIPKRSSIAYEVVEEFFVIGS